MSSRMSPSLPLLLFHGLLSSPQEFGLMAHTLRRNGIVHHAPNVPGYTLETALSRLHWQTWRQSGLDAVNAATARDMPVVLGGLCMGGMLAAAVAHRLPGRVAGIVLLSPTFAYDGWGLSRLRHLRRFGYWTGLDRFFSVRERSPFGVKNEKIRNWVEAGLREKANSAAGPARIPLRALREADRMMAEALACLREQDIPLLVIHAREDEITRLDSVRRIFDSLPARDKQFVVVENSYHMISIDNDRHTVATAIADFVKRLTDSHAGAGSDAPGVLHAASAQATESLLFDTV